MPKRKQLSPSSSHDQVFSWDWLLAAACSSHYTLYYKYVVSTLYVNPEGTKKKKEPITHKKIYIQWYEYYGIQKWKNSCGVISLKNLNSIFAHISRNNLRHQ